MKLRNTFRTASTTFDDKMLRYICRLNYGESLPNSGQMGGSIPVYGSNGQFSNHTSANTLGPVIIVGRKGSFGKLSWSDRPVFATDTTYYIDKTCTSADLRWLYYALHTLNLDSLSQDAAVPGLNRDDAYSRRLPVPAPGGQRNIAEYLDYQTVRIDELIAAKARQLQILAELRQSLVMQAVARGLDPQTPLKDSGQPWLGKIPSHWLLPAVGARFEVQLGKMLDSKRIHGTSLAPYLRNIDVQWDSINIDGLPEMDFSEDDRSRYSLRPGDILICEGGEVGRSAIWSGGLASCFYQKALHRLRPTTGLDDPKFFVLFMRAASTSGAFEAEGNSSTIQHLPAEKLRAIRYPSPPISEQRSIVTWVLDRTNHALAAEQLAKKTIDLLRERRVSLIAEAVSGEIDIERQA